MTLYTSFNLKLKKNDSLREKGAREDLSKSEQSRGEFMLAFPSAFVIEHIYPKVSELVSECE